MQEPVRRDGGEGVDGGRIKPAAQMEGAERWEGDDADKAEEVRVRGLREVGLAG